MISCLRRWPFVLSLFTALLLWCAYPGGGEVWPILSVALVPFFIALPLVDGKKAALAGFATGILHYLLLLYWIVIVLGRYGGLPGFISIPALVMLASYMASYIAGFAVFARLLFIYGSPLSILLGIPALWVTTDWLRGQLFTGFPWMDIGYGLGNVPELIQLADLFGHHGISFLVVLINCLIALPLIKKIPLRSFLSPLLLATAVLMAVAGYSIVRWQTVSTILGNPAIESMAIGIVQGNIDQSRKWSPDNQEATLSAYLEGSRSLFADKRPELIVWPETALPFYPQTYSDLHFLRDLTAQHDTALLTGTPWFEIIDRSKKDIRYFNSAQLLEPDGAFTGSYYKSHLVPFGEYVPMKKLLPFLAPLVEAVGDFSPGSVEQPLLWRSSRIGVLICFESIFPEIGRAWSISGANVLVNLTNDAWYGKSSAPYHSIVMSVFRAVEIRRSVVRSANTGISGFIDPLGRIEEPSRIFTPWAGVGDVMLMDGQTVFVRWGYLFPQFCLLAGVLCITLAKGRRRKAKHQ